MNNTAENDYTIYCNNCGSEEICDHEYGMDKSLESIDYFADCCKRCEYISKQGREDTQGLINKELLL